MTRYSILLDIEHIDEDLCFCRKNQNNDNNLPLVVGILIFDQVELLDVAGPFEVFSVTRLNEKENGERESS
jgi:hypothetical protein